MLQLKKEIPTVEFPSISSYDICDNGEKLVSLTSVGLKCVSQYYRQGIPGSLKDCYARESVSRMLIEAERKLPTGYKFKIYDGYRPICVQQRLWDYYYRKVRMLHPDADEDTTRKLTSFYVSKPSYDEYNPSLHNTGGAVDLTIIDSDGVELDMGSKFDDFSKTSWTNHFEVYEENGKVRDNRRLLYNVMIDAGFTNLPSEWWHYDYGTKFWAFFKDKPAKYKGIIEHELPDTFPLI